ncbi:regulator of chromosome condensation (RCC1) repeat-containing protein [Cardiosporidium cionae]|uniref:Regulator of chromosome condensation (RCC1) repeat-containing protein n=1 Tax=Cardiosporidium cionae TaxID=476202 RepID=A0ABQ7JAK4_9APIC|nr:regulator of chromosome condensation (RCC1) repeat-containing protein [Cardiosporidium cionae]|eukprot:KAF8821017.1 regulator of chromosome condensation (RCC1) repeat-containing protein [Cardiosporidium cionae]
MDKLNSTVSPMSPNATPRVSNQICPVSLGLFHSLATAIPTDTVAGKSCVYGWGRNHHNALGIGIGVRECNFPALLEYFAGKDVYQVSCGTYHSLVLIRYPTSFIMPSTKNADPSSNTISSDTRGLSGGETIFHKNIPPTSKKITPGAVYSFGLGTRGRCGFSKVANDIDVAVNSPTELNVGSLDDLVGAHSLNRPSSAKEEVAWFTAQPTRIRFPSHADVIYVSCGSSHSLALTLNGQLFAWGSGDYGKLGCNSVVDNLRPAAVKFPQANIFIVHCSAGSKHSLACSDGGHVYSWGHGGNGRLGNGNTRDVVMPVLVGNLRAQTIYYVAAGESHSAYGTLFTWGSGSFGKLGLGDEVDAFFPRKVEALKLPLIQVECGAFHTLCLSKLGQIYAWGAGLGLGFIEEGDSSIYSTPHLLQNIGSIILGIAVGPYHSAAVSIHGDLLCWGYGSNNRLGHGDQNNQAKPKFVATLRSRLDVSNICCHPPSLSATLSQFSTVGPSSFEVQPQHVYNAPKVHRISCGKRHSMLLTSAGNVWVWGSNKYGQLGLGNQREMEHNAPMLLDTFTEPIRNIACGSYHSIAAGAHGGAFSWGQNDRGQLGLGMTSISFIPLCISTIQNVLNVFAGDDFSACIAGFTGSNQKLANLNYGELWMWGSAEAGKLGLGEEVSSYAILLPNKVETKFPIWKCALGESHTLAITAKGEMLAWGAGHYGRLGTGKVSNAYTPVAVKFPQELLLRDAAAGSFHSIAVSMQNDIWVWGKADCICHTRDLVLPSLFKDINAEAASLKANKVVASRSQSFVLSEQNEVANLNLAFMQAYYSQLLWAWGDNRFFQLGLGKTETNWVRAPNVVASLPAPANIISAGPQHCICALVNEEIFSWGSSKNGILGIGAQKRSLISYPTRVDPRWVTVEQSLLKIPQLRSEDSPDEVQQELAVEQVQQILFQLTMQNPTLQSTMDWNVIQKLLFQEESENTAEQIEVFEDDLIHLLGHHLNFILDLKKKELEFRTLEDAYHMRLLDTFTLIPHDVPRVYEPFRNIFTSKFTQLEEFIYRDLEDPHVNHLAACLLRALAKRQVLTMHDVHLICSNDHSMFLKAVQLYALAPFNLRKYASTLINIRNSASLVSLLEEMVGSTRIYLSPEQLIEEKGIPKRFLAYTVCFLLKLHYTFFRIAFFDWPALVSSVDSTAREMLRAEFHISLDHLRHFLASAMCSVIANLSLPPMLCIILKNLYESIVSAGLTYDASDYPDETDAHFFMPIVKTLLCAIIVPLFRDSDYFIEKCGYACLPSDGSLQHNLRTVSVFIEMACCNTLNKLSSWFLLKTIADNFFVEVLPSIRHHCSVVDSLDANLVLDIYRTHLDLDESFITIRSDKLAALLNACKIHEARLNLSAHDPVSKLIKNIGDGCIPPVDEKSMHFCKINPLWYTYRANRRYILYEPNLVFCALTGAPVPQFLSPRQQPYQKKGQRLMSLLLRYVPPDKYEPRLVIQECLKKCPLIKGNNWQKLQKELGLIAEYATSLRPPNYELANLVHAAGKSIEDVASKSFSSQDVQRWISEGILERKHHRNYLKNVQVLETKIATLEIEYNRKLQQRVEQIRAALNSCELYSCEDAIREHAKKFGIPLALDSISHLKGQLRIKRNLDIPSKDLSYQSMMNFQVVDWISPRITGNQNQFLSSLRFILSATSAGNWKMEINNPMSNEKIHLLIDSEKLKMMRQSPYEACFTFLSNEEGEPDTPQYAAIRIRGQQMARLLHQMES